jgi:hypothetical protein
MVRQTYSGQARYTSSNFFSRLFELPALFESILTRFIAPLFNFPVLAVEIHLIYPLMIPSGLYLCFHPAPLVCNSRQRLLMQNIAFLESVISTYSIEGPTKQSLSSYPAFLAPESPQCPLNRTRALLIVQCQVPAQCSLGDPSTLHCVWSVDPLDTVQYYRKCLKWPAT